MPHNPASIISHRAAAIKLATSRTDVSAERYNKYFLLPYRTILVVDNTAQNISIDMPIIRPASSCIHAAAKDKMMGIIT
jgi:hypothetical protein